MTSVLRSSPSAPTLTSFTIQTTLPLPQRENGPENTSSGLAPPISRQSPVTTGIGALKKSGQAVGRVEKAIDLYDESGAGKFAGKYLPVLGGLDEYGKERAGGASHDEAVAEGVRGAFNSAVASEVGIIAGAAAGAAVGAAAAPVLVGLAAVGVGAGVAFGLERALNNADELFA